MTDLNTKHPNYNDELLPPNNDIFKPEFKRDSRGRYFMQLPGYGKWMVGNEPGSKIISQGSEKEDGTAGTDPGSLDTGSLSADTVITIGDTIHLDGASGCIHVSKTDYTKYVGPSMSLCGEGLFGWMNDDIVFGYFMAETGQQWRSSPVENLGTGDFFVGSLAGDEFILWNDSEQKLYIKGDLIIEGDLQSQNFVTGVSGWRLGYYDDAAEFQDVWVRGKITMESGSSGDADYIDENPGSLRYWAIEADANNTESRTSNNTSNVDTLTAVDTATGSGRALNAIDAFYKYSQWLKINSLSLKDETIADGVYIDRSGIFGVKAGINQFSLDNSTGDAYFRGTLFAENGYIGGWAIGAHRLWKQIPDDGGGPPYSKLELNVREAAGINMHIQAFTDSNSNYTSPTGVQITTGLSTSPNPRLDIYDDGDRRVMLNKDGLYFFDSSGNSIYRFNMTNDRLEFSAGGSVKAYLRGTTENNGGLYSSGDIYIPNNKSFWIDGTGSDYAGMSQTSGNSLWLTLGSAATMYIMNTAQSSQLIGLSTAALVLGGAPYGDMGLLPYSNKHARAGNSSHHFYKVNTLNVEAYGDYLDLLCGSGKKITFYPGSSARAWVTYSEFFHYGTISCYGGFVNGGKTFTSNWSATLGAEVLASGPVA